jgi:hypothetical protein
MDQALSLVELIEPPLIGVDAQVEPVAYDFAHLIVLGADLEEYVLAGI